MFLCLYEPVTSDGRLSRGVSGRSVGLTLLVIGLVIGAGLVVSLNYVYDFMTPRTVTTTWVETSFVILTMPGTTNSTIAKAQVQANVTSCQWSGSHEYCEVALTNSGNLVTATMGNCSLTYGGQTNAGYTGPTLASAISPGSPQQLIPGSTRTTYCQASVGGAADAGAQVTGSILLTDGTRAAFSGTAS